MIWRRQRGVVSIEVALGLLGFLGLIFYWIEVSYMGFVSSVVDYAVVEASKVSRYDPGSNDNYYTDRFKTVLALSDSFWAKFLDVDKFTMAVNYYKSVENLAAGQGCSFGAVPVVIPVPAAVFVVVHAAGQGDVD